jgi:hypothetical protein
MKETFKKLRGWLPKEPTLIIHRKQSEHKIPYMVPWLATAIVVGATVAASLVFFGDLLGFTVGYGAYFWYLEVATVAWVAAGFVAVYGYLKKRGVEETRNE